KLFTNPTALQGWFKSLLEGTTPPIEAWLGHLGGLIGAASGSVSGTGADTDPWRGRGIAFDSSSGLSITLAKTPDSLLIGFEAALVPSVSPAARIEAQATMAAIPLNGSAAAVVLPSASFTLRAPGEVSAPNLVSAAQVTIASLRGGARWNGSALQ